MNLRLLSLICLLMLLNPVTAQDTGSEQKRDPKTIPSVVYLGLVLIGRCDPYCTWRGKIDWTAPTREPDSYRIRWAVNGRYRSWKKANTADRGNAYTDGTTTYFDLPGVRIHKDEILHIQVRARYKGEKNGPWSNRLKLGQR